MMRSMNDRPFQPLTADPAYLPGTKKDRKRFDGGTRSEPGHQQRVRVLIEGSGWITAIYDRVGCRFMALCRSLGRSWWYEVASDRVRSWAQYPPGQTGFADPVVP